jgi:hypothetical protein
MKVFVSAGFSAVELLVTLVVGMIFLGAISQMYSVVLDDAAVTRNKATANALAYTQARMLLPTLGSPCIPNANVTLNSGSTPPVVDLSTLPSPRSVTASLTCPHATIYPNSALWRVLVTVSYGSNIPQDKVTHVLYKY